VQWLKPYTDEVLVELGQKGVKSLLAVPVRYATCIFLFRAVNWCYSSFFQLVCAFHILIQVIFTSPTLAVCLVGAINHEYIDPVTSFTMFYLLIYCSTIIMKASL